MAWRAAVVDCRGLGCASPESGRLTAEVTPLLMSISRGCCLGLCQGPPAIAGVQSKLGAVQAQHFHAIKWRTSPRVQEPLMARSRSRLTAEIDFDRDGKQHGFIRLPYSVHRSAYGWIPIPVACIKNGDGPRVLLMAGNHGDEYEGQVALGKLIRSLGAEEVRGRIIMLPSANFPAAMAGMRTSPLDEGNLNRSFPGDPYGGPTAQIADYIEPKYSKGGRPRTKQPGAGARKAAP